VQCGGLSISVRSRLLAKEQIYLFQRSILRHKDLIFHVYHFLLCTMLVQLAIFGHKSKRVLMKVAASILSEGVQIELKPQFINCLIPTQTWYKHFETRTSKLTKFHLRVIGISEFYRFRGSVTKQKHILYFISGFSLSKKLNNSLY